jgi:hypothetical protein
MGECKKRSVVPSSRVAVDTFAGLNGILMLQLHLLASSRSLSSF